jgi:hypothetical protein
MCKNPNNPKVSHASITPCSSTCARGPIPMFHQLMLRRLLFPNPSCPIIIRYPSRKRIDIMPGIVSCSFFLHFRPSATLLHHHRLPRPASTSTAATTRAPAIPTCPAPGVHLLFRRPGLANDFNVLTVKHAPIPARGAERERKLRQASAALVGRAGRRLFAEEDAQGGDAGGHDGNGRFGNVPDKEVDFVVWFLSADVPDIEKKNGGEKGKIKT